MSEDDKQPADDAKRIRGLSCDENGKALAVLAAANAKSLIQQLHAKGIDANVAIAVDIIKGRAVVASTEAIDFCCIGHALAAAARLSALVVKTSDAIDAGEPPVDLVNTMMPERRH